SINRLMKEELDPSGKEQTSRLTGKPPENQAAFDPHEAVPPNVRAELPASFMRDMAPRSEIVKILEELNTPALKAEQEGSALRFPALPFPKNRIAQYPRDDRQTELRAAVEKARAVLQEIGRHGHLQEEFLAPLDPMAFNKELNRKGIEVSKT